MPLSRTVFGSFPFPHRKNEPKSLYQSPSGAVGPVRTHACNARRSFMEICRSSTRCSKWCQTPRGRSENCIFGKGILPEYGADQIPPSLVLPLGFYFPNEITISGLELLCSLGFGTDAAFSQNHESAAKRKVPLLCNPSDVCRQSRRHSDALANGSNGLGFGSRCHTGRIPILHQYGALGEVALV
jgi:hypothetical protein